MLYFRIDINEDYEYVGELDSKFIESEERFIEAAKFGFKVGRLFRHPIDFIRYSMWKNEVEVIKIDESTEMTWEELFGEEGS